MKTRGDFVTVWRMNKNELLTLPLSGKRMVIDWGDGFKEKQSVKYSNHRRVSHQYDEAGVYEVRISNTIESLCLYNLYGFGSPANINDLIDVKQWGNAKWQTTRNMFYKCTNMTMSATDAPDLRLCDDLSYMFHACHNFNSPIEHWDVSTIKSMWFVFCDCHRFNQPLNGWNVASVDSMWGMFECAERFNQPLDKWDVGKVRNVQGMFDRAYMFNQPIGNWDMRSVKYMTEMFKNTVFNQSINDWNLPRLTKLWYMFDGNTAFDQSLNSWDLALVAGADEMFGNDNSIDDYREKYNARDEKAKMMGILG